MAGSHVVNLSLPKCEEPRFKFSYQPHQHEHTDESLKLPNFEADEVDASADPKGDPRFVGMFNDIEVYGYTVPRASQLHTAPCRFRQDTELHLVG